ncbi:MAG: hypothetical protein JWO02_2710, partial [Solirubrobacterales bacterium]|nr:hypothetical protein [Solirubrobacterales bacterium]
MPRSPQLSKPVRHRLLVALGDTDPQAATTAALAGLQTRGRDAAMALLAA